MFQHFAGNSNKGPIFWSEDYRIYKNSGSLPAGKSAQDLIDEMEEDRKRRIRENDPEWIWDRDEKRQYQKKHGHLPEAMMPKSTSGARVPDDDNGDDGDDGDDGTGGGQSEPQARGRPESSALTTRPSKRLAVSRALVSMQPVSQGNVQVNMAYYISNVKGPYTLYLTGDGDETLEFALIPNDDRRICLCTESMLISMEKVFPAWPQILDLYNDQVQSIFVNYQAPRVEVSDKTHTNKLFLEFNVYPKVVKLSLGLLKQMYPPKEPLIQSLENTIKDFRNISPLLNKVEKGNRDMERYIELLANFSEANHESLQGLLVASRLKNWPNGFYAVAKNIIAKTLSASTTEQAELVNGIITELLTNCPVPAHDKRLLRTFQDKYNTLKDLVKATDPQAIAAGIARIVQDGDIETHFRSDQQLLDLQQLYEEFKPIFMTYKAGQAAAEDQAKQAQQALIAVQQSQQKAQEELARLQREQAEKEQAEAARADAEKRRLEEQAEEARAQKEQEDAARAQKEQEMIQKVEQAERDKAELQRRIQELEHHKKMSDDKRLIPLKELAAAYLASAKKTTVLTYNADQIADHIQGKEFKIGRILNDKGNAYLTTTEAKDKMKTVVTAINASMHASIEHFTASNDNTADFFLEIITIARGVLNTVFTNRLKNPGLILGPLVQKFTNVAVHYAYWFERIFTVEDGLAVPSEEQQEVIVNKMFQFLITTYDSIDMNNVKDFFHTIVAIFFVETGVMHDIQEIYEGMHADFNHFLFVTYKSPAPTSVVIDIIDLTADEPPAGGIPVPDDSQGVSLAPRRTPRISRQSAPPPRPPAKP